MVVTLINPLGAEVVVTLINPLSAEVVVTLGSTAHFVLSTVFPSIIKQCPQM